MSKDHGGARRGAGRKRHVPSDEIRKQVKTYAAVGITQVQLCRAIGISDEVFRTHYLDDYEIGKVHAVAQVAGSLYKRATEGKDLGAAIFYLKSQAGWRETPQVELNGILNIHVHL